jgi:hypothetical protein
VAHEIGGKRRQPIVLTVRPAKLDGNVLTFGETGLAQALTECGDQVRGILGRSAAHKTD